MAPQNETLLTAAVVAFLPSLASLCMSIAGYIRGTTAAKVSAGNTRRLDKIENGGGDAKIDARLARHGLIDRRSDGEPFHPVKVYPTQAARPAGSAPEGMVFGDAAATAGERPPDAPGGTPQ